MLRTWRHSGFHVDACRRVSEGKRDELEKLLGYMQRPGIYMQRPPIALNRLSFGSDSMVTYRSGGGGLTERMSGWVVGSRAILALRMQGSHFGFGSRLAAVSM